MKYILLYQFFYIYLHKKRYNMLKFSDLVMGKKYPIFLLSNGKICKRSCEVYSKGEDSMSLKIYDPRGEQLYIWECCSHLLDVENINSSACYNFYLNDETAQQIIMNSLREKKKALAQRILRAQLAYKKMIEE